MVQPYLYQRAALVEPDWTRFPGWRDVTAAEWESAQWQRAHCVKNVAQLRAVLGDLLDEAFYADLVADQERHATMSMLIPPQMLNTMAATHAPGGPGSLTDAFYADPVRRYMAQILTSPNCIGCRLPPIRQFHVLTGISCVEPSDASPGTRSWQADGCG